jgi:hypothetical protein
MAATKGTQTKTAEQHNQERRAAKARQQAVRAAAAQREKIRQDNYKAGFKFVRNDGLERVTAEREEARINKLNRQHDKAADKIFGEWLDWLRAGKQLVIPGICSCDLGTCSSDHSEEFLRAVDRLRGVCDSFPDLYNHTISEGRLIVQRVTKA